MIIKSNWQLKINMGYFLSKHTPSIEVAAIQGELELLIGVHLDVLDHIFHVPAAR